MCPEPADRAAIRRPTVSARACLLAALGTLAEHGMLSGNAANPC
jgi:hypothetical protein